MLAGGIATTKIPGEFQAVSVTGVVEDEDSKIMGRGLLR